MAGWGLHPRSPPSPPLERVQVELLAGAQQRMQVLVGSEIKMRKMHAARCLELEAAGMLPSYHPYARCTQPDVSSSKPQACYLVITPTQDARSEMSRARGRRLELRLRSGVGLRSGLGRGCAVVSGQG